jgi:glucitol operon activator protein
VNNLPFFLIVLAGVTLTAASAFAQHKYYARTVRRLAAAHDEPGCVLVSGRGKGRIRGAVVVLVLRASDEQIKAAAVMEGATVFARFRARPDWVGLSGRDPLPGASPRLAAAVADARTRTPGRRAPAPRARSAALRGARPVGRDRSGRDTTAAAPTVASPSE